MPTFDRRLIRHRHHPRPHRQSRAPVPDERKGRGMSIDTRLDQIAELIGEANRLMGEVLDESPRMTMAMGVQGVQISLRDAHHFLKEAHHRAQNVVRDENAR